MGSTDQSPEDQKQAAANTTADTDATNSQKPVADGAQDKNAKKADPPAASNRGENTLKESKEDTTGEGVSTTAKDDISADQDGESKPVARPRLDSGIISDEEDGIPFKVRFKDRPRIPGITTVGTKHEPKKEEEPTEQAKKGRRGRPSKKPNGKAETDEDNKEASEAQHAKQEGSSTEISADKVVKTQDKKANARDANEASNQVEHNGSVTSKTKKSDPHTAKQDAVGSSALKKEGTEGTSSGVPVADKADPANLSAKGRSTESEKGVQQTDDRMDIDAAHAGEGSAPFESKPNQDKSYKKKTEEVEESEKQQDAATSKEKVIKSQERKTAKKGGDSEQASPSGDKKKQDSAGQKPISQGSEKSAEKPAKAQSATKSTDDEEKKSRMDSQTGTLEPSKADPSKKEVKSDKGKVKSNESSRQDDEATSKDKDKKSVKNAGLISNNTSKEKSAHAGAQSDDVAAERRSEKKEEGKRPRRSTAPTSFAQFAEPLHEKSRKKHEHVQGKERVCAFVHVYAWCLVYIFI